MEELLLNIQKICKEELGLDVNLSELKSDGGIYAELGPVTTKSYIRMAGEVQRAPVLFMCKSSMEPECIRTLNRICSHLRRNKRKLEGKSCRIRTLEIESASHKTGRTEDLQVVYSCILQIEIY
ncbi:unknown [Firmicutes bacterium CAG:646]|nr:unknown [Firmicutes bacterium CAG:646]